MDFEKPNSSSYKGGLLMNEVIEIKPEREEEPNTSCVEGLNDTGRLSAYLVCFFVGIVVQLFSFDSKRGDFIYWFILGNLSMFFGICFLAKISIQIANLNTKKRKEFGGIYWIAVIVILLCRTQIHGGDLIIVLCFFAEIIGYFQYARTYVELFDSYARKFFGNFGVYE